MFRRRSDNRRLRSESIHTDLKWTVGLSGGMDLIAVIRASGRISHAQGLNVPSSGIVREQFIEKIRRVSELRGEIQVICVDVQPVHHVVRTLETKISRIEGKQVDPISSGVQYDKIKNSLCALWTC
ncbi:hypothetical protein LOK49_LG02G00938 [Camellia lanceoleosa]|uniref:Uncharacterized protein n=1 Tax=Camellia lanceoleosa TaxID=1840588 RepID=A0ACC0ISU0_9ERIC|nr:hypothetical protein LOK49_LG02G00938 [Camellia lanceoleosa]